MTTLVSISGVPVQQPETESASGETLLVIRSRHFSLEPITLDKDEADELAAFMRRPSRAEGRTYSRVRVVE